MSDYEDFDLDADLNEVEDLVEYENPASGRHVYRIVWAGQDRAWNSEDAPMAAVIVYQKVRTVELADEDDDDAAPGTILREFFTGSEFSKKHLKKRIKQLFGETEGSFKAYIQALNDVTDRDVLLTVTRKVNKNGYDQVNIRKAEWVEREDVELPAFEYMPYDQK